jgi:hypothetical protein
MIISYPGNLEMSYRNGPNAEAFSFYYFSFTKSPNI